jgi:hypothetical protein
MFISSGPCSPPPSAVYSFDVPYVQDLRYGLLPDKFLCPCCGAAAFLSLSGAAFSHDAVWGAIAGYLLCRYLLAISFICRREGWDMAM